MDLLKPEGTLCPGSGGRFPYSAYDIYPLPSHEPSRKPRVTWSSQSLCGWFDFNLQSNWIQTTGAGLL